MRALSQEEEPLADPPWAQTEFGSAELADPRRTKRLVQIATALAQQPTAALPEAFPSRADLAGAYRFCASEPIDPNALLPSHVRATYRRLTAEPTVLAVQETTLLDYTAHPQTADLGRLGHAKTRGLVLHSTLAFTPERVPLGVLQLQVWTRSDEPSPHPDAHTTKPIEAKESGKWLQSLAAVSVAQRACPATTFVSVGDREADVSDLFVLPRPAGVDLLVRAAWDRCVAHPEADLWAAVEAAPVVTTLAFALPRRGRQRARRAKVQVQVRAVTLRPPAHRRSAGLAAVTLAAVLVREVEAPAGVEPLEWLLLLTTRPTETAEQAEARVGWYACRWGIAVWHLILKSGCRLEAKQLEDAAHLRRYLGVGAVVAWRILYATMLARELPDAPASLLLERDEWEARCCAIQRVPTPPADPPSLRQAVRWIAQLGGFLGRPRDGEPGVRVLWRGFQHLADLTTMYRIMSAPSLPQHSV